MFGRYTRRARYTHVPKNNLAQEPIPDVSGMDTGCSGIHDFSGTAPNLLLSISIFKPNYNYLLEMTIYTENLHKS